MDKPTERWYQLVRPNGKPWGSSVESGELLLKLLTPKVRGLLTKLGFRVVLVSRPRRLDYKGD
jgi:hypothetical protein